jgi:hypothetical protein
MNKHDSEINSLKRYEIVFSAPVENPLELFRQFFTDVHTIMKGRHDIPQAEKSFALELIIAKNRLRYFIVMHKTHYVSIVSSIYARFNSIQLHEYEPRHNLGKSYISISEFSLKRTSYLPIKTLYKPEDDPYISFSSLLSSMNYSNDGNILQIIVNPIPDPWIKQFLRENLFMSVVSLFNSIRITLEKPFVKKEEIKYADEIFSKYDYAQFRSTIRLLTYAATPSAVKEQSYLAKKALERFNNSDKNSFRETMKNTSDLFNRFSSLTESPKPIILNTKELSSLFHVPAEAAKVANTYQLFSKKLELPAGIPTTSLFALEQISTIGSSDIRDTHTPIGITVHDRFQHVYVIGKTGMGKSKLLELLMLSDLQFNRGFCLIDPHGDLAAELITHIPEGRISDTIYFNAGDADYSVGFNPLHCESPEGKQQVISGFIAIFKKLFTFKWTSRLEHVLRFTLLALLEYGHATIPDIVRLLTDSAFRQEVTRQIHNPVVQNFWMHEFAEWNEKYDNEAIIPIINLVGQFISHECIRNIVGQETSQLDFNTLMNSNKIVICNLAIGAIGEENASLLGSMIVTKIQEATMRRVLQPATDRKPYFIYIDEFQNFATDAFDQILSESRKFNVSLTLANQYLGQLPSTIRKTVFGNIGSLISFRVGAEDAELLAKEFQPDVTKDDLVNLDSRHLYGKLSVEGRTLPPFSARTITVPPTKRDNSLAVIDYSRHHFARLRSDVEKEISSSNSSIQNLILEETEELVGKPFPEPII